MHPTSGRVFGECASTVFVWCARRGFIPFEQLVHFALHVCRAALAVTTLWESGHREPLAHDVGASRVETGDAASVSLAWRGGGIRRGCRCRKIPQTTEHCVSQANKSIWELWSLIRSHLRVVLLSCTRVPSRDSLLLSAHTRCWMSGELYINRCLRTAAHPGPRAGERCCRWINTWNYDLTPWQNIAVKGSSFLTVFLQTDMKSFGHRSCHSFKKGWMNRLLLKQCYSPIIIFVLFIEAVE